MSLSNGYLGRPSVSDQAMKSLALPIGLANPLWLAFGAAASAGATWWLMTRWARPINLEAAVEASPAEAPAALLAPDPVPVPAPVDLAAPEGPADAAAAPAEALGVEALEVAAPAEAPAEDAEAAVIVAAVRDDLTRLAGVGPRTAAALAARGVTRFAELAAWTAEELAAFDAEMSLKGRSVRNAWLDQARRLAAEA